MSDGSGKWAIYELSPGIVRVEFLAPDGKTVVAKCTFDKPAIKEFADRLNDVVRGL